MLNLNEIYTFVTKSNVLAEGTLSIDGCPAQWGVLKRFHFK